MRTTVTLDKDVARMLREAMRSSRQSFKRTLNEAVRKGLRGKPAHTGRSSFLIKAKPMGLREGIDPTNLNKLADELEMDAVRTRLRPARHK